MLENLAYFRIKPLYCGPLDESKYAHTPPLLHRMDRYVIWLLRYGIVSGGRPTPASPSPSPPPLRGAETRIYKKKTASGNPLATGQGQQYHQGQQPLSAHHSQFANHAPTQRYRPTSHFSTTHAPLLIDHSRTAVISAPPRYASPAPTLR